MMKPDVTENQTNVHYHFVCLCLKIVPVFSAHVCFWVYLHQRVSVCLPVQTSAFLHITVCTLLGTSIHVFSLCLCVHACIVVERARERESAWVGWGGCLSRN